MQILSVTDNEFRKYGRIVDNIDFTALVEELKRTPIPAGVVYEPAVKELEALPVRLDISAVAYGEMPVQIMVIATDITQSLMLLSITEIQRLMWQQQI